MLEERCQIAEYYGLLEVACQSVTRTLLLDCSQHVISDLSYFA